jgi:predicted MFS family arabinose efflux permease
MEGILMATCGIIFHFAFDPDLINIEHTSHHDDHNSITSPHSNGHHGTPLALTESSEELPIGQVVKELMGSPPFVFAVALSGCINGGIVFALYFCTQVSEARGMNVSTTLSMVMLVFVTAPIPGILTGSWIVNSLGGYTDHVVTFGVALASSVVVLLSAMALHVSWILWADTWQLPYVLAFWMYSFVGAMAAPPLNGVAVSAVPRASHVASALQFAMANAGKIVVPQIGGYLCSSIGLIHGFHVTVVGNAVLLVILAGAGTIHATKKHSS